MDDLNGDSDEAFLEELKQSRSGRGWLEEMAPRSTKVLAKLSIREQKGKRKGKKFSMRVPWSDPRRAIRLGRMEELEISGGAIRMVF